MEIRDALPPDADAIAAIYNDVVAQTTAIWSDHQVDGENRREWMSGRQRAGYPVLVATRDDGPALGYASYGDWRAAGGYRHTVELSVHVRADQRGAGLGRALLMALIDRARASSIHVMVAAIEAGNAGSIRLHERLGFRQVGLLPEVGTKFGTWLDLAFLQLVLDRRASPDNRAG